MRLWAASRPVSSLPLSSRTSPGFQLATSNYATTLTQVASHGYVVVAITHPDSTALGAVRGKPTPNALPERLQDVQLVLARLEERDGHPARASVLFFWPTMERQVRVTGSVSRLTEAESAAYFASRPRESQIGAWASRQSELLPERRILDAARAREQELVHAQFDFAADLERRLQQKIERASDRAFGGVFHRHDRVVRRVVLGSAEHGVDRRA